MADFKCGYDLAGLSVRLFTDYETYVLQEISQKNEQIAKLVEEMEDLEFFLSLLAKTSAEFDEKKDHIVEITAADAHRIQNLMENPELRHIFPPAKFSWKEGEITAVAKEIQGKLQEWSQDDNLKRLISQRIEGPLQRKITMETDNVRLSQEDLVKVAEICTKGLHRMTNLNERILNNMLRAK